MKITSAIISVMTNYYMPSCFMGCSKFELLQFLRYLSEDVTLMMLRLTAIKISVYNVHMNVHCMRVYYSDVTLTETLYYVFIDVLF